MDIKDKIKLAATDLFMRYGIRSVSMDDIAKEAGVSKKTVYQNIEDKATLVKESLHEILMKDREYVTASINLENTNAFEKLLIIFEKGFEIICKIKPTVIYDLQKYYRESWELVQVYHIDFMRKIICENIKDGIKEEVYRKNIDAEFISKIFTRNMVLLNDESLFPAADFPRPRAMVQHLLYHLHGIIHKNYISSVEDISTRYLKMSMI